MSAAWLAEAISLPEKTRVVPTSESLDASPKQVEYPAADEGHTRQQEQAIAGAIVEDEIAPTQYTRVPHNIRTEMSRPETRRRSGVWPRSEDTAVQKHENSSRFPRIATTIVTIVMLLIGGIAFTGSVSAQDANKGCPQGVTVPDGMHCEPNGNGGYNVVVDSATDACANITVPAGYKCENGNVVPATNPSDSGTDSSGGFLRPTGYCTLGTSSAKTALAWDGRQRVWMNDDLATNIKTQGGTCHVDLGRRVAFTYNSVEGQLMVDNKPVKNGNGILTAGSTFDALYAPDGGANGFDLWVDLTVDPNSINTGSGNGGASTPTPTALATGTCTVDGGTTYTLDFDPAKGVLYMDNFLTAIREANQTAAVDCTLVTTVPGVVEIHGQTVSVAPNTYTYHWDVNAGTDLGFNWKKTS